MRAEIDAIERIEGFAMAMLDEAASLRVLLGHEKMRDKTKKQNWMRSHYKTVSTYIPRKDAAKFYEWACNRGTTASAIIAACIYHALGRDAEANQGALAVLLDVTSGPPIACE